ncbi:hypothetical protein Rsub_02759 [Raphidocelis subcapitata]|uniref:Uncharacterized protein n=1 Tax=Raphidocelis subcapitata TaxID=307507 RepID=A0A2V0NQY3_9CHLO|nr:hypothetical protein Rsub_02759 [Raphidocelis subcapitata]|eukprot:GBF90051.1 hypothetical protein Rsub_02759 [Raphidocelis subcapitata]
METPEDPDMDLGWAVVSAGVRCVAWWALWGGTAVLGFRLRGSRSNGWTLYKVILAVVTAQALKMTSYLSYADAVRRGASARAVGRLYLAHIPFSEAAEASFLGLLLLLASGFSITRADMGAHKAKVYGIPAVILVTGIVTDVIYFQFTDSTSDDVDFLAMAPWEGSLWFVCTLLNVACLILAWVYAFDIIGQETEALESQEAANNRTDAPAGSSAAAAAAAPHEAAANEFDEALGREGITVYKQLGGAGAGLSAAHVAGADPEEAEFRTVADRINFEIKKKLYKRFSFGVGAYLLATIGALLLPVYMNVLVQGLIVFLQFVVQWAFMAALVWIFRPVEDSPYLMVGTSAEHAAELGVADLGTALDDDRFDDEALAMELGAIGARAPRKHAEAGTRAAAAGGGGSGDAGGGGRTDQGGSGGGRGPASQGGAAVAAAVPAAAIAPPPGLPPVRTRLPAAAPAAPRFSLGDEDEASAAAAPAPAAAAAAAVAGGSPPGMHVIRLNSGSPPRPPAAKVAQD